MRVSKKLAQFKAMLDVVMEVRRFTNTDESEFVVRSSACSDAVFQRLGIERRVVWPLQ